ncbi:hypothetical protein [Amniculibacterium aquaticum]|uniref:hypothetical protein n=1 Tax=Amniculibacterium aquaticum TaxID=2479858 RepID=UPI000F5B6DD2|nr:hypothetical protein [Amniculibacterium aquaticum]
MENYKLQSEKLNGVIGGEGGPAPSFIAAPTYTSGGERCDADFFGNCYTYTYTGDVVSEGHVVYINDKITNTPCN